MPGGHCETVEAAAAEDVSAASETKGRFALSDDERGSAVAEFAMVSGLVVLFFLAAFQLGFSLYVRNTLIENAAEGARYGARADATPAMGAERARGLIGASLSGRYARNVTATVESEGGAQVVRVTVRAPLPIIGPFGPSQSLTVSGRAYQEAQ